MIADLCAATATERLFERIPALAALRGFERDTARELCLEAIADAVEDVALEHYAEADRREASAYDAGAADAQREAAAD